MQAGIDLHLGLGFELYQDSMQHQLDVVVAGPEGKGGLTLIDEPLVWVGPKDLSLGENEEGVPLVKMPPPCRYRQAAFDAMTTTGLAWHVSMNANSVQDVQSAVAAGLGISVMARSAVNRHMKIMGKDLPELPKTSINAYWNTANPHSLTERFITFRKSELMSLRIE